MGHQVRMITILNVRKCDYLESKIYHGFYAVEALSRRSASQLVCGICGIIPDILLGKYFVFKDVKIITKFDLFKVMDPRTFPVRSIHPICCQVRRQYRKVQDNSIKWGLNISFND